ncbi:hypothetical protein PNA2_0143 [Pyrococcus sp. NA2]|uniref:DUF835 domain-containing protein n=1 Tax=Pyrococcus sp. (strain NA2) TaxID=342949 RepID=UPI000209AEC0|nr:DUF835 domain-containing protein [Pyrococcus sp. NA2]AEC51061.1 hypothetical protein PNA2_0143 [Pyrococcus sp. NA2]
MYEIVNLIMRILTWILSVYRWARKRENFMLLISIAFWIDFLAGLSQKPLIQRFGLNPDPNQLLPLTVTFATIQGVILLIAALYLINEGNNYKAIGASVAVSQLALLYVLLCVLLNAPHRILTAFPISFLGFSMIFVGYALFKREIYLKSLSALFPLGLILLGIIDITYPITSEMSIAKYLYFAGGIFRIMIIIGILKYVLIEVKPPETLEIDIPSGAFYLENNQLFRELLKKMNSLGNGVLITRHYPRDSFSFPVFWLTKVTSGRIGENVIAISPTDLGILLDLTRRHIERGHSLVVIDGFEYLVIENGFENAMKFLIALKDHVVKRGGSLVLFTSPQAYSESHWNIIKRELEKFRPS